MNTVQMKTAIVRTVRAAALIGAAALALPSMAADRCSVPKAEWQPQAALETQLKAEGWTLKRVKVDSGCYEVYGMDKQGHKQEVYFDPKTLKPVK